MKNNKWLHYDPISRRQFIRTMSGALVAFPLIESFIGERAYAAALNEKRFIAVTTPNQLPYSYIAPSALMNTAIPANYQSAVASLVDANGWNYRRARLADIISRSGRISDLLDSKFNVFANQMLLYRGLDFPGRTDHGRSITLGNMAGSHLGSAVGARANMTIDEFMANSLSFYPNGRFAVTKDILRLGEMSISTSNLTTGERGVGIGGNNAGLSYNGNLSLALENWFTDTAVQTVDSKKSIVDRILASVNSMKSKNSMGSADVVRIEEFQDKLSELSAKLATTTSINMAPFNGVNMPNFNPLQLGNRSNGSSLITEYYTNLVQLVSLAIKCGVTKIVTVGVESSILSNGIGSAQGDEPRTWHLEYAHGENTAELLALNKWVVDNVVFRLAQELNVNEGSTGAKYLDNTCIFFSPESSYGHAGEGMSGFTIGGSSSINTGNYFDYGNYALKTVNNYRFVKPSVNLNLGVGLPINRLHLSLLRSMGLSSQDYINKFGNSGPGFGYWLNSYANGWEAEMGDIVRANIDSPLPEFLKVS